MAAVDTAKTNEVLTNDISIKNLPLKYYSNSELLRNYFSNRKRSGISSFKEIVVDQNAATATLRLENDEGTYVHI